MEDAESVSVGSTVWRNFRRFSSYAHGDRRYLLIAGFLLAIGAAAETASIWMFGVIADGALLSGNLNAFWQPAGIWVAMTVVGGLASYGAGRLSTWVAERILLRLRDAVYAHLQRLSPQFFETHDTGDLLARLTGDIEMVEHLIASGVVGAATSLITVLFFAGAALYVNWQLALAAFIGAPLLWLASRLFSRRLNVATREERDSNGAISGVVEESLATVTLVQTYNQQQTEQKRVHQHGVAWMNAKISEAKVTLAYTPLVDMLQTVSLLAVIGAGIWEIGQHRLTIGGLLALASYLGYLYPPLQQLGELTLSISSASASADRIGELLDEQPDVVDPPQGRLLGRVTGHVVFQGVGHTYPGSDIPALRDLSFEASPGQFILVTGGSGAGKSTLTRLLLRFADPASGRILLDGVDLRGMTLESLRNNVTLVHQEAVLRHGTVRENIAYGFPEATEQQIQAAAVAADADEFIRKLPEGYETALEYRGERLSGGQRQRLSLARALLRNTPVLVLDEPTANLDNEATQRVLQPLRQLAHSRTVILITHDLTLGPAADTILVLEQGKLVEQGTHDELLRAAGRYSQLHEISSGPRPKELPAAAPRRAIAPPAPPVWPLPVGDLPTVRMRPPMFRPIPRRPYPWQAPWPSYPVQGHPWQGRYSAPNPTPVRPPHTPDDHS